MDAVIIAVAHKEFSELSGERLDVMFKQEENQKKVIAEVKGILDKKELIASGYNYWRL